MKELESYGVNTSNFHEKSELVDVLKRAREIISRPPQDATSSIRKSKQKSMIRMMCLLGAILMLITAARYSLRDIGISSISNIKVEEEKKNVKDEEKEEAAEEKERNLYSRFSNPNTSEFVNKIVALEGAEDGYAFATGMSAIFSTFAALFFEELVFGFCFFIGFLAFSA